MRVAWLLLLAACGGRKPPPAAPPEEIPADVPIPREGGPIAGPRAVVDAAPPPPVPEGTPGGGPLPPYVTALRKAVGVPLDACLAEGPASVVGEAALVVARLDREGRLLSYEIVRKSGVAWFDGCLARAFESATFPKPPEELLDPEGKLETPQLAFR